MALIEKEELEQFSSLFRGKMGNTFARIAMRISALDKVCDLYDRNETHVGPEFAQSILEDVGVKYSIGGLDNLKKIANQPFITISNHIYGHLDGIMLVDLFGHIRDDYKLIVNKFLSHIKTMCGNFIEINPNEAKANTTAMRETLQHLSDEHPLGVFPSGAVSDLSLRDRCIRDRQWQTSAIRLIQKAKVPVVPVRFFDRNSMFYYLLGLISWKVRLVRLPHEVFNKAGKQIRLGIGNAISVERQATARTIEEYSKMLRDAVYGMPLPDSFVPRNSIDDMLKTNIISK